MEILSRNRFNADYILTEEFAENNKGIIFNEKFFRSLNEDEKMIVFDYASSKIIQEASPLIKKINNEKFYGDIPKSKGDITKFSGYKVIRKSISLFDVKLQQTPSNCNNVRKCLAEIKEALKYLETYKKEFIKAYNEKITIPMELYKNVLAMIVIQLSTIASDAMDVNNDGSIEVKKEIRSNSFNINSKNMKTITSFNDMCHNKKIMDLFRLDEISSVQESCQLFDESVDEKMTRIINENSIIGSIIQGISNTAKRQKELNTMSSEDRARRVNAENQARNQFWEDNKRSKFVRTAFYKDDKKNMTEYTYTDSKGVTHKDIAPGYRFSKGKTALFIIGSVFAALQIIRGAIFAFYYFKNSISSRLEYLSKIVDGNAATMSYNGKISAEIKEKQRKSAEKMREYSKKLSDDTEEAIAKAEMAKNNSNDKINDNMINKFNANASNVGLDTLLI